MIAKYSRICCTANLHKISELLEMDMSTHMCMLYFDIHICLFLKKHGIINVHVLAIPVFDPHTSGVLFDTASKILVVLHPV